jgi:catechol 2,3-dioxygenase-like lactoylglutathione lyase family enzyme
MGGFITGDAMLFSPTEDAVAIWDEDTLTIRSYYPYPVWQPIEPVIMLDYGPDDESLAGRGAWTSDGRVFAYSDARGLWLWDWPSSRDPILLIPAGDEIPVALYFSPGGRYLVFREGDQNLILDLWLDTVLPGEVPDDMDRLPYTDLFTVYDYLDPNGQSVLLEYPLWPTVTRTYIQSDCGDSGCFVIGSYGPFSEPMPGTTFTYELTSGTLAVLAGPDSITFVDQDYDEPQTLTFSLDGDIVKIEWMRSEFYEGDPDLSAWEYPNY